MAKRPTPQEIDTGWRGLAMAWTALDQAGPPPRWLACGANVEQQSPGLAQIEPPSQPC